MNRFDRHPDELLSASVSGDLTAAERRELNEHLAVCAECRATLDAYTTQRQLFSGMRQVPPPRDLAPRVRAGIESGRFGAPWWRRPGGILAAAASLATVAAAAVLAVVLIGNLRSGPVASSSSPSAAPATPAASASASPVPTPTEAPTIAPLPLGIQSGDTVYLTLGAGPSGAERLTATDQRTGTFVTIQNPSGVAWGIPQRAVLSPDDRLLAFSALADAKGTLSVFVTNLADGSTVQLGEGLPLAFGHRLGWSPDGRYLAYTLAPWQSSTPGTSDVWLYDTQSGASGQLTSVGNAYFAGWGPTVDTRGGSGYTLWISLGATQPSTIAVAVPSGDAGVPSVSLGSPAQSLDGVWLPLFSPDSSRAIFWRGTMTDAGEQGWIFSVGGLPYLSGTSDGAPTWSGEQLFADLSLTNGGQAFAFGSAAWGGNDSFAFWGGAWTGTPQSGVGAPTYPDRNAVYVGHPSGLLTQASRIDLGSMTSGSDQLYVVDVALDPAATTVVATIGVPTPGSVHTAILRTVLLASGGNSTVGATDQPTWYGPAVVVP